MAKAEHIASDSDPKRNNSGCSRGTFGTRFTASAGAAIPFRTPLGASTWMVTDTHEAGFGGCTCNKAVFGLSRCRTYISGFWPFSVLEFSARKTREISSPTQLAVMAPFRTVDASFAQSLPALTVISFLSSDLLILRSPPPPPFAVSDFYRSSVCVEK